MKIKALKLFTNKFELEKVFYAETLGFKIIESSSYSFTVRIGWSNLTFEKTENEYKYHYCFLIPSNKLEEALRWAEKRVSVVNIKEDRKIQRFESWNADSFYFYDASGNIAEFIVRYDLDYEIDSDFNSTNVLCINEIGMPTNNIEKTNNELHKNFGTEFWKGNLEQFGTNGSQEGLFLLPNYTVKEIWFPTSSVKTNPDPFEVHFENNGKGYNIRYENGEIITI